jgi:hypothetical protein
MQGYFGRETARNLVHSRKQKEKYQDLIKLLGRFFSPMLALNIGLGIGNALNCASCGQKSGVYRSRNRCSCRSRRNSLRGVVLVNNRLCASFPATWTSSFNKRKQISATHPITILRQVPLRNPHTPSSRLSTHLSRLFSISLPPTPPMAAPTSVLSVE